MSHSKHTKRGYSIYLEKWNPSSKRYINTCAICGSRGYSLVIEAEDFDQRSVFQELKRTLPRMEIDEYGRCNDCAGIMDKVMNNEGESYGRIN